MGDENRGVVPEPLQPETGEQGLLSQPNNHILNLAVEAWQLFLDGMSDLDLDAGSRDEKLSIKEQLIPMGNWTDNRSIYEIVADAREGAEAIEPFTQTRDRLREVHSRSSNAQVVDAVHGAAQSVIEWSATSEAREDSILTTPSPLGPIPVGTFVLAAAFQMAATWRDIAPDRPKPELERLGLTALVDSTGAVAGRLGATASITAITPEFVMGTGTHGGAWRTSHLDETITGPAVVAPSGLLIDFAAGNVNLLKATRKLRVRQPRRLGAMAIVLEGIPDLPAAGLLKKAARMTSFMAR